jgi:hypothetical protein
MLKIKPVLKIWVVWREKRREGRREEGERGGGREKSNLM